MLFRKILRSLFWISAGVYPERSVGTGMTLWGFFGVGSFFIVGLNFILHHAHAQPLPPPFEAIAIIQTKPNTTKIYVEVADTPLEQQRGLMYRKSIPLKTGMWFPLQPMQVATFWMKNCKTNLDMVVVRNQKIVEIWPNVPPCGEQMSQNNSCPTYTSKHPVDGILELKGGAAKQLGVEVDQVILIKRR